MALGKEYYNITKSGRLFLTFQNVNMLLSRGKKKFLSCWSLDMPQCEAGKYLLIKEEVIHVTGVQGLRLVRHTLSPMPGRVHGTTEVYDITLLNK